MSYLVQEKPVRYECTCGSLMPISKLYFCRHCLELRCGYCLCHEVDSHYCSNCMEHLPSAEAKMKRNRCPNCFDCPSCFLTLSVRATTRSSEPGTTTKTPTKHYYLACFFCRWTTRDVGIPDQPAITKNWYVEENEFQEKFNSFLEHYKIVAMRERNEKEKKPFVPRRYATYTERFGLTNMIARKRAGLPPLPLTGKDIAPANIPVITPFVASDHVEPLPESFFTEAPDLTKITTISQRHANPSLQPEIAKDLRHQHRHFYIKRSLRCRSCDHNVSKPEYDPGSIKFKIQLAAYYHMPEIRIMTFEPFKAGQPSEVILKVTNPTVHLTSLQFSPYMERVKEASEEPQSNNASPKKSVALPRPTIFDYPNSKIELPTSSVVLPPQDDAAEYDDSGDTHNFQDDPKVVIWRKGNRAAVKFVVTPNLDLPVGSEVFFGFNLEYGYVNTMPSVPQRIEMQVNVLLAAGEIYSSD